MGSPNKKGSLNGQMAMSVYHLWVLSPHADERREGEGHQADLLSLQLPVFGETEDEGNTTHRSVPVVGLGPDPGAAETKHLEGPFVLSEALPVVPAKMVKRILKKGEFVDMAELLKDNLEAERRRFVAEGTGGMSHFTNRQSRREVPDILSWLHCFSLYAAVVTSKYPEKTKELLAYQATIIAEARRCGGRGWALYDAHFRQQMASLESADFSKINQSLYSTTFLAYGSKARSCTTYMLPDHTDEECALHPNREVPLIRMREPAARTREEIRMVRPEMGRKKPRKGACFAWNGSECARKNCFFEHACSRCFSRDHTRPRAPRETDEPP